jgi:hypothetical protein
MLIWQKRGWRSREIGYNQKLFTGRCSGVWVFSMVDYKLYAAAGDGVDIMLAIDESLFAEDQTAKLFRARMCGSANFRYVGEKE